MKFLVFSDITWDRENHTLAELQRLVCRHKPDSVLLAGDLVDNDKFGHRECLWQSLYAFLAFLERRSTPVFAVRGNWDDLRSYAVACAMPGVRDISEQVVSFRGVKLLGVSHAATKDLRHMRDLACQHRDPVDIILTHAQYGRRPWLFLLDAQVIVTGHFDIRLTLIKRRILLSMWNSPGQYALVEARKRGWRSTLFFSGGTGRRAASKLSLYVKLQALHVTLRRTGCPAEGVISHCRGKLRSRHQDRIFGMLAFRPDPRYEVEVASLLKARASIIRGRSSCAEEERRLRELGVAKTSIDEFLRCT